MWRNFSKALSEVWRMSVPESGGAYRPDKHYMRGPGPKWQAKYGGLPPRSAAAGVPAASIVGQTAATQAGSELAMPGCEATFR